MYSDCLYDLKEIRRCPDCYRLSNEKADKMWFCIPCDPPHQLVYAKQKGYPYWPAKVMNIDENNVYDVRFFGGHHLRANIEETFIRPSNVNISSLQVRILDVFLFSDLSSFNSGKCWILSLKGGIISFHQIELYMILEESKRILNIRIIL